MMHFRVSRWRRSFRSLLLGSAVLVAFVAAAQAGLYDDAYQRIQFVEGQRFGPPVSLFAEYQHTWWQDASFDRPAASSLFNYTFARQDDVVKLGFTVDLDAPIPAAARKPLPVK